MRDPIYAVVTPFSTRTGFPVDPGALRDMLMFLSEAGVRRIIAGGTTGEFFNLTLAERRLVLECCRSSFDGEVIAHISSTCADEVRELAAHAADHADCALVLPPYYYADVSPDGVCDFFTAGLGRSPLPVYLYNFPRHTQVTLAPDLVARIRAGIPSLAGIKDSGGNLTNALAYRSACGPDFEVYLGADSLALDALRNGLTGPVTGGAQPVPELLLQVVRSWAAGADARAEEAQQILNVWTSERKLAGLAEPAVLKAALGERLPGFSAAVRPPFRPADELQQNLIRNTVRKVLSLRPSEE